MHSKILKNKGVTAITLTSLLLLSFCLIPCGKAGLLNAEASVATKMAKETAGEMKGHNCHGTSSGDFQIKEGEHGKCLHCDSSTLAIVQTYGTDFSKDHQAANDASFILTSSESSTAYVKWTALRPPGPDRPIYLLNTIFII